MPLRAMSPFATMCQKPAVEVSKYCVCMWERVPPPTESCLIFPQWFVFPMKIILSIFQMLYFHSLAVFKVDYFKK